MKGIKGLFHTVGKTREEQYDAGSMTPALRCSICTGEKVAGFVRKGDGSFMEVMLIHGEADLQAFKDRYGINGEIEKIY